MVTLVVRLCALCAVCSLLQMVLPEESRAGIRVIGGMLMLHLVISGMQGIRNQLIETRDLKHIFEMLIR